MISDICDCLKSILLLVRQLICFITIFDINEFGKSVNYFLFIDKSELTAES